MEKCGSDEDFEKKWKLAFRSTAIVLVVLVVYLSIKQTYSLGESIARETASQKEKEQPTVIVSEPSNTEEDETQIEAPAAEAVPTLEEYLGGLFCSGCGKHCPLIAPRCGRGEKQAREAEIEYNNTYNTYE